MSDLSKNRTPNKLIEEKSPYLQQHAYNPVHWYPWGEEAFRRACDEDKPIFLSIGYSTCHWCHVMERESFEDEETAAVLNNNFVSIKVDREERPDVDNIYMNVCQMLTGRGGWPLSVFLDCERKPFFAGTYFPKEDMRGLLSFKHLLQNITMLWNTNRGELAASAEEITAALRRPKNNYGFKDIDSGVIEKAFKALTEDFDGAYGGFSHSPKFPTPHVFLFLFEYFKKTGEPEALAMAEKSLQCMYRGGIFDHIGGGFSRYSTDNIWLVPHFEKMLYDNALLALVFSRCHEITGKKLYKTAAEETLNFLDRDMSDRGGGFYSAFDADSEGEEGKFYLWDSGEIEKILGGDAKDFCKFYGVTKEGNFEGANILNMIRHAPDEIPSEEMAAWKQKLFKAREKRIKPHLDRKILTAQNCMAVAAFAEAGRIMGNESYVARAVRTFDFITKTMFKSGRLYSSYIDGEIKYEAFSDDYAYFILAALSLYEVTEDEKFFKEARKAQRKFDTEFWDKDGAGYFLYGTSGEQLIARPKEITDNAYPSGNSVAVHNLLKLHRLTGDKDYKDRAERTLNHFGDNIERFPSAHIFSVLSVLLISGVPPRGEPHFYCDIHGNCGPVSNR